MLSTRADHSDVVKLHIIPQQILTNNTHLVDLLDELGGQIWSEVVNILKEG